MARNLRLVDRCESGEGEYRLASRGESGEECRGRADAALLSEGLAKCLEIVAVSSGYRAQTPGRAIGLKEGIVRAVYADPKIGGSADRCAPPPKEGGHSSEYRGGNAEDFGVHVCEPSVWAGSMAASRSGPRMSVSLAAALSEPYES